MSILLFIFKLICDDNCKMQVQSTHPRGSDLNLVPEFTYAKQTAI